MDTSIRDFTIELLEQLGAEVAPDGPHRIVVDLPQELASRFNHREVLSLSFRPDSAFDHSWTELVIPGSYWLDRMVEIARERGEVGAIRLPVQVDAGLTGESLPEGYTFLNGTPTVRAVKANDRPYLLVNFKLTFMGDDIEELIWPSWIDLISGEVKGGWDVFPWRVVRTAADAPALAWGSAEGLSIQAALDLASKAAKKEASRLAQEKDRKIERQLQEELLRLDAFYGQLLREIDEEKKRPGRSRGRGEPDLAAERKRLRNERDRREQEAWDRVQLKVTIRPVNAVYVLAPGLDQEIDVTNEESGGTVTVFHDLVRGGTEPSACPECGEPLREMTLCRRGHLVCSKCADPCHHCGRVYCRACGLHKCPLCNRRSCLDCVAECAICRKVVCRDHVVACEDSWVPACTECGTDCPSCRRRYDETPLERCALGEERICAFCLTPCPFCGKSVCPTHRLECAVCGRTACTHDAASCPRCGQPCCGACVLEGEECRTCRALFPVRKTQGAIVSLLTSAGIQAQGLAHWRLAENFRVFLVEGRSWWWRHLFVIDKDTLDILSRRRFFRIGR
jgi:hypothetical protein